MKTPAHCPACADCPLCLDIEEVEVPLGLAEKMQWRVIRYHKFAQLPNGRWMDVVIVPCPRCQDPRAISRMVEDLNTKLLQELMIDRAVARINAVLVALPWWLRAAASIVGRFLTIWDRITGKAKR